MAKTQYNKQGYKGFYGTTTLANVQIGADLDQIVGLVPCRVTDEYTFVQGFVANASPNQINETTNKSTTVTLSGDVDGVYYYRITGILQEDIDIPLEGTITLVGGTGSILVTAIEDFLTEGNEVATVSFYDDIGRTNLIAATQFTIVDTSQGPFWNVTIDNVQVTEGESTTARVSGNSGNVTLYYRVFGAGITVNDFNDLVLEGTVDFIGGQASLPIVTLINQDGNPEAAFEVATIQFYTDAARTMSIGSVDLRINNFGLEYELIETFSVTNPNYIQVLDDNGYIYGRLIEDDTNVYRRSFNGINSAAIATIPLPNQGAAGANGKRPNIIELENNNQFIIVGNGTHRDFFRLSIANNSIDKRINDAVLNNVRGQLFDTLFNRYLIFDDVSGLYEVNSAFTTSTKRTTLTRAWNGKFTNDYYFISTSNNQTLARVNRTDFSGLIQTPTLGNQTFDVITINNQYVIVQILDIGFNLYDLNLNLLDSFVKNTAFLDMHLVDNLLYVANDTDWQVFDVSQGTFNLLYTQNVGTQNVGISANSEYVYVTDFTGNAIRIYRKLN